MDILFIISHILLENIPEITQWKYLFVVALERRNINTF